MIRVLTLFAIAILLMNVSACASADEPVTLKVALYPYVPMRRDLFEEIESTFERAHPGVNIELVDEGEFNDNYYSGALLATEADVYEVDTILLTDMIAAGKIATVALPGNDFAVEAVAAVTRDGKTYAVPHWRCGNFLFFRKSDTWIAEAGSWEELVAGMRDHHQTLAVDFEGTSTLGEWYLTLLSNKIGIAGAQQQVIKSLVLDTDVVALMRTILTTCPQGFCRSGDLGLHDRTGYYARAFVRGQAAAYVGYSESIHYGLQEVLDDCLDKCLKESDIAVRALPAKTAGNSGEGIGWVDGLALAKNLPNSKAKIAKEFVDFMVSDEGYKLILEPEWLVAPKYLMPTRQVQIKDASLYPTFVASHQGRATGTLEGLNARLRATGKKLNCVLSAVDETAVKKCE